MKPRRFGGERPSRRLNARSAVGGLALRSSTSGAPRSGLSRLDALYETTMYPSELLWGRAAGRTSSAGCRKSSQPKTSSSFLDGLFMLQCHAGRLYSPRIPDVAAGLAAEERQGTWYLVRADFPVDALTHARAVASGQCFLDQGPCACAAPKLQQPAPGTR
jgi:hypothetical protein